MGPQGGAAGGRCSFLTASGGGGGGGVGAGSRVLAGRGGGGAAAAAGAGEPVGADAGVGLGTAGVKGTSPPLCSWLRWRPETLAELQVLGSGRSFVGTPLGAVGEKSFSDPTSDTEVPHALLPLLLPLRSLADDDDDDGIQILQTGGWWWGGSQSQKSRVQR